MAKGTPIVIAGSAYPKAKKTYAKKSYGPKNYVGHMLVPGSTSKRRMSTQGGRPGAKRVNTAGTLYGTGDYEVKGWTPGADMGRPAGRWAGHKVREYANSIIPGAGYLIDKIGDIGEYGAKVGAAGGHFLGTLFGSGDYHGNESNVSLNSIINPSQGPPMVVSGITSKTGVRFRRREYLKDIVSSGTANTYVNEIFSINPGQAETFPWLSAVAENFEQYRICGMVFEFVSLSADATASVATSLGFVAMATQYDVLDTPFVNKQQLENYDMAQSCKPSRNQIHGLECAKSASVLSELYVRPGASAPGSDLRMYDFGNFNIAHSAPGVSVTLGELWVSYDIELFKPKISTQVGGIVQSVHAQRSGSFAAVDLGVNSVTTAGTIKYAVNSGTNLKLFDLIPGSKYKVTFSWACNNVIIGLPSIADVTNGSYLPYYPNENGAGQVASFQSGNLENRCSLDLAFKANAQDCTVILNGGSAAGGSYTVSIWVTQFDNSIDQ